MSNTSDIQHAAADIYAGLQRGEHFPSQWKGKFDLDAGYTIQLAVRDLRAAGGDKQVGWKVGLTAKAIQEMENFDEPIFAVLFESGVQHSGCTLIHEQMIKPAFENELCIVLREPLKGPGVTMQQARAAIATIAPALEIVEARGVLSEDPALAIADNLGQKAFVAADAIAPDADLVLSDATCDVKVNDVSIMTGSGSAVLDDPAHSVAWLANKLAQFGEHIQAGQAIMSGSFTVPTALQAGDRVQTQFTPFGSVSVQID
jgi:2-keto-4-pentenoate hydratase